MQMALPPWMQRYCPEEDSANLTAGTAGAGSAGRAGRAGVGHQQQAPDRRTSGTFPRRLARTQRAYL